MADHRRDELGQVLWGLLVMLGLLSELAIGSLQLAAHEGIAVTLLEQRWQQEQRLQVIAGQLARLPIPGRSLAPSTPWHPLSAGVRQGCGQELRVPLMHANQACSASGQPLLGVRRAAGEWQWRLQRIADDPRWGGEGSDESAFPALQAQHWQLEVVSTDRAGLKTQGLWQRYRQVSP